MSATNNLSQNAVSIGSNADIKKIDYSHEESMTDKIHNHELNKQQASHNHSINLYNKELGWLGTLFGGKEMLPLNISGLLIIVLILIGSIYTAILYCVKMPEEVKNLWDLITPILTLALGYLFGMRTHKSNDENKKGDL